MFNQLSSIIIMISKLRIQLEIDSISKVRFIGEVGTIKKHDNHWNTLIHLSGPCNNVFLI